MGHIHLGVLPSTLKWREVVRLLEGNGKSDDVIAATAVAVENDLRRIADDAVFIESVRLLLTLPQAATASNLVAGLALIGIDTASKPGLMDLVAALGDRLDAVEASRSDFSELARRALLSTVTVEVGGALPGLLEATPNDLRTSLHTLGAPRAFAGFARAYFTTLLSQTLNYWLDRTLSAQVGPGKRFANVGERREFDTALAQYCMEATRIIREFSAGWYGKTLHRGEGIGVSEATIFGAVAFKKITEELARKRYVNV